MKSLLLFILGVYCTGLFAQKSPDTSFIIKGTISGFADGTEVILENANDKAQLAKAKFLKGKFTLKGKLDEPTLCWLKITGEPQQYIYLENKAVTLTGSKPLAKNLKVSGSASHNDFTAFQQLFNPLIVKLQATVPVINNSPYGAARDSLIIVYESILDSIQKSIDLFIGNHLSSHVSPFALFVTSQFYDDPVLLESRFNRLDSSVKITPTAISLKGFIDYNKVGAVGTTALDFTQPDTSGAPVTLSSFKGKYVLVDFWASWCGPCRMENPNVVSNYNKFKEKNFTVLGVSLDRPGHRDDWISAIHKDKLTWTHVSDLQFWNNAAAKLYRVSGIPFNFLVDPQGKIIGKNLRGPDLESKLCEVLGCN
jgi:peroxiredoxin